jgi:3-phenylpropionate/cinnamic acid dioxygenase small subunit
VNQLQSPSLPASDSEQALSASLVDFIYRESRLLDEARYEDWYECFAEDGIYWVPLSAQQLDGENHNSLAYEDKLLLQLRIERLKHARAFSQQPGSRGHHLLQRPEIEVFDPVRNLFVTRTQIIYSEFRLEDVQHYAATVWHHLRLEGGLWKLQLKRCDLLNAEAMLASIQLFI